MYRIKYQKKNSKYKIVEAVVESCVKIMDYFSESSIVKTVWKLDNQCIKVRFFLLIV